MPAEHLYAIPIKIDKESIVQEQSKLLKKA